ncbi:MAG: response regulator [Spirochaetia bacterium]|nr:response regulator [Spirochaetia bacterium]
MITAMLLVILCLIFVVLIDMQQQKEILENERLLVTDSLNQISGMVEILIAERLALLEGLRAYTHINVQQSIPLEQHSFSLLCQELISGSDSIRNMIIAPGGINEYVYPLAGNEASLGHDILHDARPQVAADVQRAISSSRPAFSGPYDLRQGGRGLVVRSAVFHDPLDGSDPVFWGLVSMVIDMPSLLSDLGVFDPAEDARTEEELFHRIPLALALRTSSGAMITGDQSLFTQAAAAAAPVVVAVHLIDDQWQLAGMPSAGWGARVAEQLQSIRVIEGLLAAALVFIVFLIMRRNQLLRSEIARRTRRLEQEIREHEGARDLLEHEKQQLAFTLRSIEDAVITADLDGCLVDMNLSAEQVTGMSAEDAVGTPVEDVVRLYDDRTSDRLTDPVTTVLITGLVSHEHEHTFLYDQFGDLQPVAVSASPLMTSDGQMRGAILVIHDLKHEQLLQEHARRSERLESLGVLAGGIAHDFNNLLSGVFGFIELARDQCPPDTRAGELLNRAMEPFDRARGLTKELLTFSRGGEPERHQGDLGALAEEVTASVLKDLPFPCSCRIEDGLWKSRFDADQIRQVLENVLYNAVYAVEAQKSHYGESMIDVQVRNARIYADLQSVLPPGNYICIIVRDTGVGIDPQDISRVYDPFFSSWDTGGGLGLTTAYSIIQKHNGSIEITSKLGEGSEVHIYLPAVEHEYGQELDDQNVPTADTAVGEQPHQKRALVMDDEMAIREFVEGMLNKLLYEVDTASCGEEVLGLCAAAEDRGLQYDTVILDLTVPGALGGQDIIGELRKQYPRLRIIASSGYVKDPVMAYPVRYGFDAALIKPYRFFELAEVITCDIHTSYFD